MKLFTLLICTFALSFSVLAQNNSNFTISTTGNTNLKIRFGGKQYSLQDRSVTFQSLQPGTYTLQIFQLQRKSSGATEYVEVFNNNVTLTAQKHLEVSVLRFGKVAWDESYIEADDWNTNSYNPVSGNQGNNANSNNYGPVSSDQFTMLKKAMEDASYDQDKLATGGVILKNNLFTTTQIKELCRLFSYDNYRLDFAKLAYDYCIDKGTYIAVLDVFDYQSNKTALLNYIKSK